MLNKDWMGFIDIFTLKKFIYYKDHEMQSKNFMVKNKKIEIHLKIIYECFMWYNVEIRLYPKVKFYIMWLFFLDSLIYNVTQEKKIFKGFEFSQNLHNNITHNKSF